MLSVPEAAVLSVQAAKIDRPYLAPTSIDLNQPLDANAIAVIAVLENADLKALRAHAGVADAQAFAARLLPDPTFNLAVDNPNSAPGVVANIVGQLVQDINLLRTHRVLAAQNKALTSQVRLDLAWAEWQTAGAARIQAVRVAALEKVVRLNRESKVAAEHLLDTSLRAALRGDMAADPVQANRLAALDAADKLRTNEAALEVAQGELVRLLGFPPGTVLRLAEASQPAMALDSGALFAMAQQNRTDLKALTAGYAAQEASVHKAVLDQFPTLTLGLTGTRDSSDSKFIGGAVNFTLPLWNRNRGGIAVAQATRAALKADYDARLFQTRSDIATAVAGVGLAKAAVAELNTQLPALEHYAAGSAKAAARGDLPQMTATLAAQTARDRHAALISAQQAVAEQMIALELLSGTPIATWTQAPEKQPASMNQ